MISLLQLKNEIQKKRVVRLGTLATKWQTDESLLRLMLEQLETLGYVKKTPPVLATQCDITCNDCTNEAEDLYYFAEEKTKPQISMVVAFAENYAIGKKNQLLWHLPHDLQHFKNLTSNKMILMGRKTYESIGRPLPGRQMIVLTHNSDFHSDYAKVIHSPGDLFPLQQDLVVIGGAEIYKLFLAKTSIIHATIVKAHLEADAFFPSLPATEWQEITHESHFKDEKHAYDYTFVTYKRVNST